MNINIDLNEEQSDVLNEIVSNENSILPNGETPYSQESYLKKLILAAVNGYVKTAYENSLLEIGSAAATLPYSNRKNLISQVKTIISS